MIRIQIEDIIGNAFIPYLEKTGKRILPMKKIDEYASKVVTQLNSEGIDACLDLSREKTNNFFYKYSNMFKCIYNGNEILVALVGEDVTSKKLIYEFSEYLSFQALLAFRNEENIKILLK